jgi:hypothetical protein
MSDSVVFQLSADKPVVGSGVALHLGAKSPTNRPSEALREAFCEQEPMSIQETNTNTRACRESREHKFITTVSDRPGDLVRIDGILDDFPKLGRQNWGPYRHDIMQNHFIPCSASLLFSLMREIDGMVKKKARIRPDVRCRKPETALRLLTSLAVGATQPIS